MNGRLPSWWLPWLGGLLLAASTPPAFWPGAELLVVPGLAVWYQVAVDVRRPGWHTYLLGCLHMAWFSWSVHHVLVFAWVVITLLGGVYYLLAKWAVRGLGRRGSVVGFAVAAAGACWLRANVPDIHYPHGQPCHALWQWPLLLRPVVIGGEALVNALLAYSGAVLAQGVASWRLATPTWAAVRTSVGLVLGSWLGLVSAALFVQAASVAAPPIAVVAIEPGFHPFEWLSLPRGRREVAYRQLLEERLLAPTRRVLAEASPPAVVLWPESSLGDAFVRADIAGGRARAPSIAGRLPASTATLVVGANVDDGPDSLPTPAALAVELPSARVLAIQEKRLLVPGGEFLPLLGWLPAALADSLRRAFQEALGSLPEALPGRERPPLHTAAGVPFGALLCYDNAFPGPAAAQVGQGARWLAVLSNESWYEGGAELAQLMAQTVVRALETATPIVRCTQDGWSGVVAAAGRLVASLPLAPAPQPAARILRAEVTPGPGALPPLAWLRGGAGPASAIGLGLLLLHAVRGWARLRAARTASRAELPAGSSGEGRGSGS